MEIVPIQEASELSVAYRNPVNPIERPVISSSADAFKHLLKVYDHDILQLQEQFTILFLNRANAVLGVYRLATGTITGVAVDIRIVLGVALKIAAVSLICSHSHPSTALIPSTQDRDLTNKLKEGAKLLDLRLLDHLIVSGCGERFYSFADSGDL